MPKCSEEILKQEYGSRLELVEAYIRAHLDEDLTLEKLAAIACFSKYHFHRVFKSRRGETVHDCIRRIRLEESLRKLKREIHASISEIAYSCGFSGPQNFARAFKAHFGFTPASARTKAEVGIERREIVSSIASPRLPLRLEVKEMPRYRVAFVRDDGPHQSVSNAQAFFRLFHWASSKGIFNVPALVIAVRWAEPGEMPFEKGLFDACVTVTDDIEAEGDVGIQYLPGGKHVISHCEIPFTDLPLEGRRIVNEWLPSSGFQRDRKPYFVIMYNNPRMNPRNLAIVDICMPIRPL